MHRLHKMILGSALVLLLAGASTVPAHADLETWAADLAGGNEVPPVATTATGAAALIVDTVSLQAFWTLEFADLSSAQTGAHFHNAPAGTNGGVVEPLPLGSPVNGVWAMTPAEFAMLADGNIYVNVHTQNFAGGEIRGQLTLVSTVANEAVAFGGVKALFR